MEAICQTVTVSGTVVMEDSGSADSVKVVFERMVPIVSFDSTTTDSSGNYSKILPTGIYKITYLKTGYFPRQIDSVFCYANISVLVETLMVRRSNIFVPDVFSKIQDAIDYSNDFDTVTVMPGIYYENINFNDKKIILCSKYMSTLDTSYIDNTIIDGSDLATVVVFDHGETNDTKMIGFTIQHGHSNGTYPYWFGGGIRCIWSSPVLQSLIIRNNTSITGGGGLYFNSCAPLMDRLKFIGNHADDFGGGIGMAGSILNISNSLFYDNNAAYKGGAIAMVTNGGASVLTNLTICNNQSISGGGIYIHSQDPTIQNCIISDNTGYGIYIYSSGNPTIRFNCLYNNSMSDFYNTSSLLGQIIAANTNGTACDAFYNIFTSPVFNNYYPGDYSLSEYSPCIDAGENSFVNTSFDLLDRPRIMNGNADSVLINVDLGAYEAGTEIITSVSNSLSNEINFEIIPNPFSIETILHSKCISEKSVMTIYNSTGQIMKPSFIIDKNKITILRNDMPSGIYYIYLAEDGKILHAGRIVVLE